MKKSVLCSVAIKKANQVLGSIKKKIQNKTVTLMVPPPYRPMVSLHLEQCAGLHPPSISVVEEEQVLRRTAKVTKGVEEASTYAVSMWGRLFSLERKPLREGWSQSLRSPV